MERVIILLMLLINIIFLKIILNRPTDHSLDLQIKESNIKGIGRGLFAMRPYKKGQTIELCPTVEEEGDSTYSSINDYVFDSDVSGKTIIALGYCGLINESIDKQNCSWDINRDDTYIRMYATKDINVGDELYTSYGDDYWSTRADLEKRG
tara:strand:+ start:653 stop:1105 length:453 start_codon:yes stop_codon:yes gene_type:complete